MPILIGLLGLIAAAGIWAMRVRAARAALDDVSGIAGDVLAAARRLGFRRKLNVHPVESIEEPGLAIAGLGIAFLDLAALPTAEQLEGLKRALAEHLHVNALKADELTIVGRWLVNECKGPDAAITRLSKRLRALEDAAAPQLLAVLNAVGQAGGGSLSPRQRDALEEIARQLRLS